MAEPTPATRTRTYERDGHRCVSCGSIYHLQYQHRAAEGMGGYPPRPTLPEGLTSCATCNPDYEGRLQALALRSGWKVRRWVRDRALVDQVPVLYAWEGRWCRLTAEGDRVPVSRVVAMRMMRRVYGPAWDDEGLAA